MKLRYVFAAICMFSFVALVAWAYNKVVIQGDHSLTVPVIKAEGGPYKVLPDDPGGMDVPHLDSAIYNALDQNADGEETIRFAEDNDGSAAQEESGANDAAPKVRQGFKLPQQERTADKPKVESLFSESGQDSDRDRAIAKARENIEKRDAADVPPMAVTDAPVSDEDIRDMQQAMQEGDDIAPEEVDAGIIIVDPNTQEDTVDAPQPAIKPASRAAPTPSAATPQKFAEVLESLTVEPVAATDNMQEARNDTAQEAALVARLAPVHEYAVSRAKPVAAAPTRRTAFTIDPQQENAQAAAGAASPAASPAPPPSAAGDYFIQLASLPSRQAAEAGWRNLQSRYASVLGGLQVRYKDADLGARGIYTRIQAGPLTEAGARQACADLMSAGKDDGCLVVGR